MRERVAVTKEPAGNDWTSQLRRGVLELCVLKLLRNAPNYGYEIVTSLESLGPLAAGENTVYPLLRRLKMDRHLETFAVESPAGPPRQYYRLTTLGRQRLAALEHEWGELVRAVERCLKEE
jgi:PadR family transcriptional regulator